MIFDGPGRKPQSRQVFSYVATALKITQCMSVYSFLTFVTSKNLILIKLFIKAFTVNMPCSVITF